MIMTFGCKSSRSENEVQIPPQEPKPFPELTERNRLLGDLLPERTCYDVIHYLIDLDIDIDKKYIRQIDLFVSKKPIVIKKIQIETQNGDITKIDFYAKK